MNSIISGRKLANTSKLQVRPEVTLPCAPRTKIVRPTVTVRLGGPVARSNVLQVIAGLQAAHLNAVRLAAARPMADLALSG